MLKTSSIVNTAGRTLTLIHASGHADIVPQEEGAGDRRYYVVKIDGEARKDRRATSQQAAMDRALMRRPMARSVVVRSPR